MGRLVKRGHRRGEQREEGRRRRRIDIFSIDVPDMPDASIG